MRNLLVIAACGTIGFCGGGELPYCVDGIYPHLAMTVDARMPGGNVVVKRIEDDGVTVSPDSRDTEGGWFYWAFRVTGAAGRKVAFRFEGYEATVGSRGPAVSFDCGATWEWGDILQPSGLRTSYEIPFANARFKTLEPQDLRAFGRDVAAAWRDYLAGR